MIMRNRIIEAAILAVGLVGTGIILSIAFNNFTKRDRLVTVKGLAEMEVPADKVIWPLMYKDLGNDLTTLYTNMQSKNKTIIDFLESNGITREEISVAPPEIIDMEAERYINQAIQYRYNATSVITVTSSNVDKIRKLISEQTELLKQGVAITGGDYRYNTLYEFTGLNNIKPRSGFRNCWRWNRQPSFYMAAPSGCSRMGMPVGKKLKRQFSLKIK